MYIYKYGLYTHSLCSICISIYIYIPQGSNPSSNNGRLHNPLCLYLVGFGFQVSLISSFSPISALHAIARPLADWTLDQSRVRHRIIYIIMLMKWIRSSMDVVLTRKVINLKSYQHFLQETLWFSCEWPRSCTNELHTIVGTKNRIWTPPYYLKRVLSFPHRSIQLARRWGCALKYVP